MSRKARCVQYLVILFFIMLSSLRADADTSSPKVTSNLLALCESHLEQEFRLQVCHDPFLFPLLCPIR